MPRKKPEPDHSPSTLTFTIETFDDPETGEPTQYGRFSRNWQDEEALDALIDQLEAGRVTHKQALMQARKLEATTPDNLEIQNFIDSKIRYSNRICWRYFIKLIESFFRQLFKPFLRFLGQRLGQP